MAEHGDHMALNTAIEAVSTNRQIPARDTVYLSIRINCRPSVAPSAINARQIILRYASQNRIAAILMLNKLFAGSVITGEQNATPIPVSMTGIANGEYYPALNNQHPKLPV